MQIKCHLQAKTVLNKYVVDLDVSGQQGMDFFHWRKHYWIIDIKVKNTLMVDLFLTNTRFSLHQMLTVDWSGVDHVWVIVKF